MLDAKTLALGGDWCVEDARISDRNTVSLPKEVMRRLRVGPKDYVRFMLGSDHQICLMGMALKSTLDPSLERLADEGVQRIRGGDGLTLDEVRALKAQSEAK